MSPYRVRRVFVVSIAVALAVLLPGQAPSAQSPIAQAGPGLSDRDFSQDIPAHLAYIEGEVTLERDGKLEPAERNLGLLAGDRLRTRSGRVEILYADSSTLAVDVDTSIDLLSEGLVRLLDGSVHVTIPRTKEDFEYRIDTRAAAVEIHVAGEYRVDTGVDRKGNASVDLTVIRGTADLANEHGHTLVRAGQHAVADAASEPSDAFALNSAAFDEFDQWVDDRRTSHVASPSAEYLPQEAQYYSSTMDDYGTWGYEASYGTVWYPRVAADWHPYWQGRWSYTPYYGWFWVGIDAWSWPTHHYGSWGLSSGRWYWIPGHYWSPAWVSWYTAPGYVAWCARGYNGLPAVPFHQTSLYGEPWRSWTTVASNQFRPNMWVTENVVPGNRIPPGVRDEFKERPVPAPVGPAVPRRTLEPLRAPTRPKNFAVANVNGDASRTFGTGDVRSARTGTIAEPRAIGNAPASGAVRADQSRVNAGPEMTPRTGVIRDNDPRAKSQPQPASSAGAVRGGQPRVKPASPVIQSADRKPADVPSTGSARSPRVIPDPAEAPRSVAPKSDRSQFDWERQGSVRANPRAIEKPRVEDPAPSYSSRQPSRQIAPPDRQDPPSYDSSRGRAAGRSMPSAPSYPPDNVRRSEPPQQQAPPPSASRSRGGDQGRPPSYQPPSYSPPSARNPGPPSAPPPSVKMPAPQPQQSAPPPSAAPPSGKQSGGGGATQSQGSARGGGGSGGRGKGGRG